MTPDEMRAMYVDQIDDTIAIRRYSGTGFGRTYVDHTCRAAVQGYAPVQLVGSITQGDRRIIAYAADLDGESPPFVIAKTDKAIVRGAELSIIAVDDSTRRVAGELIAYDLQVRG